MPNSATSSALVETATKCFAHRVRVAAEPGQRPFARRVRVGHRLERREGLRRHDEQRLGGIEVLHGLGEVGAVDVRDEAERQVAVAVVLQRLVRHHRPEVRAADADVDDVADPLARVARPRAAADARPRSPAIRSSTSWTCGHDVLAVDDDRRVTRRAQRDVQHRAVLGDVDPVAAEHRVDARRAARTPRRAATQQPHRLVGDAVLRVVEVDADCVQRQPLPSRRIRGEELPQVKPTAGGMMRGKGLPGSARRGGRRIRHARVPR